MFASSCAGFDRDDVPSEEIEHAQMLLELRIGKMRCLDALGEWTRLIELAQETWPYLQARQTAPPTALYKLPEFGR